MATAIVPDQHGRQVKIEVAELWEHVAGCIYDLQMSQAYGDRLYTEDEIHAMNQDTGWSFEAIAPNHEYSSSRDYTRYEGYVCTDADLRRAIDMADGMLE